MKRILLSILLSILFMGESRAQSAAQLCEVLARYERQYTRQSSQYADALMWAAMSCAEYGDNKQAQRLMTESCDLFRLYGRGPFEGRDTINEIFLLDLRAKLEYKSGRDFRAVGYQRRSCELKRLHFGEQSEVYLNALLDLSKLCAERLDYRKSVYYHNLGYRSYVETIKREFCSASESERSAYWDTAARYIYKTVDLAHSSAATAATRSLASAAYNALLLSKGLLLNTTIGFENYVKSSGNPEAMATLSLRKALVAEGVPTSVLDSLDYAILGHLRARGQAYAIPQLDVTWRDVAGRLADDDLAIEFYRNTEGDYGAILLKRGWSSPRIVRLKGIIRQGKRFSTLARVLARNPFVAGDEELAADLWSLSKAVWTDEIVAHFPRTPQGRVYFAADGELLVSAIEYLPFIRPRRGEPLHCVSDLFPVFRLSSTRELVARDTSLIGRDAVVYGGLIYDMTAQDLVADMTAYPGLRPRDRSLAQATRLVIQQDSIQYLEGTKVEADTIVATLEASPNSGLAVRALIGKRGTEASFKALDGKRKRLIHIATHGFYYDEADSLNYERFLQPGAASPLLRSGLFMAGAEHRHQGHAVPDGVDDGILTAQEISLLNLDGLDLVVLSACETARGDLGSDGVFGLQRGFKMASARSILMSLWSVYDEATCYLMTEFYRHWTDGKTKHEALELARQAVRSHKEKGWDHPRYWAAFVLLDGLQ